jgi:hypothetical protein
MKNEIIKKWSRDVVDSHDCKLCHNKIILITTDYFGNTYCGYCGKLVHYPKISKEEFLKCLEKECI